MFTPEKMEQIQVLFSEKDVQKVTDTVVRQGALQVIDTGDVEGWAKNLPVAGSGEESQEMRSRREKVESLMQELHVPLNLEKVDPYEENLDVMDDKLDSIQRELRNHITTRDEIDQELTRVTELRNRVHSVVVTDLPITNETDYSYLAVQVGNITEKNYATLEKNLQSILHILTPLGEIKGYRRIVVMALRRDKEKLDDILNNAGFEPVPLKEQDDYASPELVEKLDEEIVRLRGQKNDVRDQIKQLGREKGSFLQEVLLRIRQDNFKRHLLQYLRKTERTYLLSGWIPQNASEGFVHAIRKATQNRCVIEKLPADSLASVQEGRVHVPVRLSNPKLFKPFELLTTAYGVPDYQTIDPTPILGISFLIMFGVMFGDVGHGLVLALIGAFMTVKGKRIVIKNAGLLLLYGGCASIIFGFLFGSIFGLEHLIPTLWLKPMESITRLFQTAIYFGIGMITLAIGVNMINGFRRKDFLSMIFDKAGFLAFILYWSGIVVASRVIESGPKKDLPLIIPILLIGSVALLFLREPIIHLIQGKKKLFPQGITTGIMGSIVELLEILLGFLANTVSFIRVAAFGLAHAGLFMAIFALSDAMKGPVMTGIILLFGNILIICLEGLVVSIQAVRLEFYEFFSRFFHQGSAAYTPVGARIRQSQ